MTQNQKGILWIGVLVVLIFLFTDQNFRNQIFGRGNAKPTVASVPYSTASVLTSLTSPSNAGIQVT